MKNSAIRFVRQDHLAILDFNRPSRSGEDVVELAAELSEICSEAATDDDIRVVVVNSEAKPLPFGVIPQSDDPLEWTVNPADALAALPQPVLLGLGGQVLDQGLELALACDVRVAREQSRFGMTHLSRGQIPCWGGIQRLSRLIGKGHCLNMILEAAVIDARDALRIGLVNRMVSSSEPAATLLAMAQAMAAKGPLALRYAKEAIAAGMDLSLEQGLRLEADLYFLLHTSRDRTEGIRAFQQKRKAEFTGK